MTDTATRLRGTVINDSRTGNPTGTDWSTPDTLEIPGCAFDPGGSREPVEAGRNAVVSQPKLYDPTYADVQAGDRITVRDVTYEVQGNPAEWRSPFSGWSPGQVIELEVWTG